MRSMGALLIDSPAVVKAAFHRSLRAEQGFLESVFRLIDIDQPVSYYPSACIMTELTDSRDDLVRPTRAGMANGRRHGKAATGLVTRSVRPSVGASPRGRIRPDRSDRGS